MVIVLQIIYMTFSTLVQILINPIYWIVIFIVYLQYKKIAKMEKKILGRNKVALAKRVFSSSIIGFIGGVIGSLIIILLGISIEAADFGYIFIVALVLMLIHPRFICFSYAGGLLSISSLVFGYPKLSVSSIMAIVAILHLIESFLILKDGDRNKVPIFIERGNRIVGGFNMTGFWPIPFLVLLITSQTLGEGGLSMPQWWPLFKPEGLVGKPEDLLFVIVPVMAALGYGDMAITDYPQNKVRQSAKGLAIFSGILLILAIVSSHVYLFKYIAAIFSPVAHEVLIQYGRRKERRGNPVFVPSPQGVKILDVIPTGIGDKMNLKAGDVILSLNGHNIESKYDIKQILSALPPYIWIDYYDTKGRKHTESYKDYRNKIKTLDVLIIPKDSDYTFLVKEAEGRGVKLIRWIIKKVKNKKA